MNAPKWLHGASVALSAFLIFQVQLCLAKFLLPWFGGSPSVWSTSMAFFQVVLTLGYAWAEALAHAQQAKLRRLHFAALAIAVVSIALQVLAWHHPLLPDIGLRPEPGAPPLPALLRGLFLGVGLPFFVLSTNSTLQQALFARRFPHDSPYRLYALSNLGSLVGLLSYPFVLERVVPLSTQAWLFLGGFLVFASLVVSTLSGPTPPIAEHHEITAKPTNSQQLMWVLLPACASGLLVATTNRLTADVAPVPFLWVLPLALYLATFVLTFEADHWYRRVPILSLVLLVGVLALWLDLSGSARQQLNYLAVTSILLATLFVTALGCHGELAQSRPSPKYLARFFLLISVGGSLGSVLASLVAPLVFSGSWELPSLIVASWVLLGLFLRLKSNAPPPRAERLLSMGLVVFGLSCAALLLLSAHQVSAKVLVASRNFHGRLQVEESTAAGQKVYLMTHGRVVHGLEFAGEQRALVPTSYFSETSGVGVYLNQPARENWTVGVVGLGAGVLAAWCHPDDRWTFYELDPDVVRYASGEGGYFRFLSHCPSAEVVVGDARRSLEAELAEKGAKRFDLLVLDAFSGDSIPAHLVTKEAFALYRAHLKPDGVLAFHISNLYLELSPVVARLARETGFVAASLVDVPVDRPWAAASEWMLMSTDASKLELPRLKAVTRADEASAVWTDDFSDLVSVLNVRR